MVAHDTRYSSAPERPTPDGHGAVAFGRIIEGYGARKPASDLPLVVEGRSGRPGDFDAWSDEDGHFVLTGLPLGTHQVYGSHLSFVVPVTRTDAVIDLGVLKYPLIHPPTEYWWTPTALPSLEALKTAGESVEFAVCKEESDWRRPSLDEQAAAVWSRAPFVAADRGRLESWFQAPAVFVVGVDRYMQSEPGGLDVSRLGDEERFLTGLWNTEGPIASSVCSYEAHWLTRLLDRDPIELWLLGHRAREVRRLVNHFRPLVTPIMPGGKGVGVPAAVGADARYGVYVEEAPGYQVIRIPGLGTGAPLAVHVIEDGAELVELSGLEP